MSKTESNKSVRLIVKLSALDFLCVYVTSFLTLNATTSSRSFRDVVSPCALQEQWPCCGLLTGHHEHGGVGQGGVPVPHCRLPFGQLWQGDVNHRVEWVENSAQLSHVTYELKCGSNFCIMVKKLILRTKTRTTNYDKTIMENFI